MRDPKRIRPLLKALEAHWTAHPNLRLGQLIVNLSGFNPGYVEDDALLAALKATLADEVDLNMTRVVSFE